MMKKKEEKKGGKKKEKRPQSCVTHPETSRKKWIFFLRNVKRNRK